jgi:hypothetical protein
MSRFLQIGILLPDEYNPQDGHHLEVLLGSDGGVLCKIDHSEEFTSAQSYLKLTNPLAPIIQNDHEQAAIEYAKEHLEYEGDLEFDDNPLTSTAEEDATGTYVQCWKWVPFGDVCADCLHESEGHEYQNHPIITEDEYEREMREYAEKSNIANVMFSPRTEHVHNEQLAQKD